MAWSLPKLLSVLSLMAVVADLVLAANSRQSRTSSATKSPNIIFIMTDDQDIDLGSMNYMPKTLKILRDGGAHFPNSFVTTPMCCPSRSSMLTGMYAHNHNVYTNNDNCSSPMWQQTHESRSFATYLNNAGYRTGYFGKYLNEYDGDYIPPGYREWMGLVRNSRFYNYTINMNGKKIKHGFNYERDYFPDLIANDSITFLRHSKQFYSKKPVMMVMSFPSPHGPEDAAPQYSKMFMNVTSHRTPSWNYAPNPDKQWLLRYTRKMEPIHIKFTDFLHSKRLQTLQSVDDAVERIYHELVALDELENTYIFYTSDHGYHLGQFGLIKGKAMPFEFDIRVPFYVRGPNVPQGIRIPNIVLNIDIAPTFLDIGGISVPEHMDGKSIVKLLNQANQATSSGRKLYNGEVKRRKAWRDSFLIERGKISPRQLKEFTQINQAKLTKEQKLEMECQKADYSSPCKYFQRWECINEGGRWRIQKCRTWPTKKNYKDHCSCPPSRRPQSAARAARINRAERRMQRNFLKMHVNRGFQPVFIGSRNKRQADNQSEFDSLSDDVEFFDVDGVYQINDLLDMTVSDQYYNVTKLRSKRSGESPRWKNGPDESWRPNKENINQEIKALRERIDKLKSLRKQLRSKRPTSPDHTLTGLETGIGATDEPPCDCSESYKAIRHNRRKIAREERMRIKEAKLRRKEKRQKRKKISKYLCNAEKMNCFSHDNNHWKTAPFWTNGPFCFCQNANNNTYWCLRTINDTHNFLYCEFITGFLCYYDLTNDPYQLRNEIYNLDYSILEELRAQLNLLRKCKGSNECTIRYRRPDTRRRGVGGDSGSRTRDPVDMTGVPVTTVKSTASVVTDDDTIVDGGSGQLDVSFSSGDSSLFDSSADAEENDSDDQTFPAILRDDQFIPVSQN